MNRKDLQTLTRIRLAEAQTLLKNGHFEGAYYLCGYAVECALKACIAKQTKPGDFPDKKRVMDSHTHNLESLVKLAGLRPALDSELRNHVTFNTYWNVVKDWTEESRYLHKPSQKAAQDASDLIRAIGDRKNGVLRWIKKSW